MLVALASIGLGLVCAALFGYFLIRGIKRSLSEALTASNAVAQGDLTHPIKVRGRDEIADLLRRLNRERGVTMVVATHDLHLAARLCDHLVLIRDGRVLAQGTPATTITPDTLRALYGVDADVVHDHATAHVTVVPRTRVH